MYKENMEDDYPSNCKISNEKTELSSKKIFRPVLGQWDVKKDENNHLVGSIAIKTFPTIGHTFLNLIRRFGLGLSSAYSVAGFKFKILTQGREIEPTHEYECIMGLKEDVPSLHYNIKGIIIKCDFINEDEKNNKPIEYFSLKFKSSGKNNVVYGDSIDLEDFKKNNSNIKLEIINKNHVICNLDMDSAIEGEILFRYGFGYASEEENNSFFQKYLSNSSREGWFFLSSRFSNGVVNIKGDVTEVTSGSVPYDLLDLKIITNGSIEPSEVLTGVFKLVKEQIPYDFNDSEDEGSIIKNSTDMYNGYEGSISLSEIGMPSTLVKALNSINVNNLESLLKTNENILSKTKGIGKAKIQAIKVILAGLGLSLESDKHPYQTDDRDLIIMGKMK